MKVLKTLWEKNKLLFARIFSFPCNAFKRLFPPGLQNCGLGVRVEVSSKALVKFVAEYTLCGI